MLVRTQPHLITKKIDRIKREEIRTITIEREADGCPAEFLNSFSVLNNFHANIILMVMKTAGQYRICVV